MVLNLTGLHMQSSGLTRIPHAFKANVLDVVDLSFNNISKLLLNDLAFLRLANSTELHIEDSLLCLLEFQALLVCLCIYTVFKKHFALVHYYS